VPEKGTTSFNPCQYHDRGKFSDTPLDVAINRPCRRVRTTVSRAVSYFTGWRCGGGSTGERKNLQTTQSWRVHCTRYMMLVPLFYQRIRANGTAILNATNRTAKVQHVRNWPNTPPPRSPWKGELLFLSRSYHSGTCHYTARAKIGKTADPLRPIISTTHFLMLGLRLGNPTPHASST
jgi:hypothetical protein